MKSPNTGRQFTAAEEALVDDGLPPFLIANADERKAWWDKHPPKTLPVYFDPRLEADKELRAAHKREQTARRIFELRKSKGLIPDNGSATSPSTTGVDAMPKYVIKPLDEYGHPVMRAVTSVNDTATQEDIDAKVLSAVERGGSKVVAVTLTNTLGEVTLAWSVDDKGEVGPTDVGAFKTAPATVAPTHDLSAQVAELGPDGLLPQADVAEIVEPATNKESEVVKKVKGKSKVKKAPKAKKATGEVRKGSKVELIAGLLKRKNGCTAAEVLKATGWPAVSMPAQAKQAGLKLRKEKVKGQVTRYFGS